MTADDGSKGIGTTFDRTLGRPGSRAGRTSRRRLSLLCGDHWARNRDAAELRDRRRRCLRGRDLPSCGGVVRAFVLRPGRRALRLRERYRVPVPRARRDVRSAAVRLDDERSRGHGAAAARGHASVGRRPRAGRERALLHGPGSHTPGPCFDTERQRRAMPRRRGRDDPLPDHRHVVERNLLGPIACTARVGQQSSSPRACATTSGVPNDAARSSNARSPVHVAAPSSRNRRSTRLNGNADRACTCDRWTYRR